MRDTQRERVYSAEWRLRNFFDIAEQIGNRCAVVDGVSLTLPAEYRFSGVEDAQRYCDRVLARLGHDRPVRVRARAGEAKAHYFMSEIAVPMGTDRWALREIVLLHELAHHLSTGDRHGPWFVSTFVELLSDTMGPEVGLLYRMLCAHAGVKEGVRQ